LIAILLANLGCALFLAGIAWFLQVVQLPLLRDAADFSRYIRAHRLRNTLLMALPMAVELVSAMRLWESGGVVATVLLVLVLATWLATFAGIIPGFRRLVRGYDKMAVNRLIGWNGVRTVCWTARSGALLYIVARGIRI
jgi:hypothetical protein